MSIQQQPEMLPEHSPLVSDTPTTEAIIHQFWQTVHKSADVIVTLRQENAIVGAQNVALRRSETDLQGRVDDLLKRIAEMDVPKKMRRSIDKTEDHLQTDRQALDVANEQLKKRDELIEERNADLLALSLRLLETEARLVEAQFSPLGTAVEPEAASIMNKMDIRALAARLDNVADRVAQLLRIS